MKTIFLVLLALLVSLNAPAALAESDSSADAPIIQATGIGIEIKPVEGWSDALTRGNITGYDEYGDIKSDNSFASGRLVLVYMEDTTLLANVTSRDEGVQILNASGIWLMDVIVLGEGADQQAEFAKRENATGPVLIGSAGGYDYYCQLAADPSSFAQSEETKAQISALMAPFATPADWFNVVGPATESADTATEAGSALGLGDFNTTDIYGNAATPEVFAGAKLTMVNIWGTYCSPCIEEMPELAAIHNEYKDKGFQIVGIVSDVTGGDADSTATAQDIAEATGATYLHLIPDAVMYANRLASVYVIPTTFFVDENGNVVGETYVAGKDKAGWLEVIDPLLADQG